MKNLKYDIHDDVEIVTAYQCALEWVKDKISKSCKNYDLEISHYDTPFDLSFKNGKILVNREIFIRSCKSSGNEVLAEMVARFVHEIMEAILIEQQEYRVTPFITFNLTFHAMANNIEDLFRKEKGLKPDPRHNWC